MPGLQHKGQRKYNDRKRCNGPRQNRALQSVVRAYSRHQSAQCELYRHICVPYGSRTTTSLLKSIMSCTLYCDKRGFWAILLLVINTINKNKLLSDSLQRRNVSTIPHREKIQTDDEQCQARLLRRGNAQCHNIKLFPLQQLCWLQNDVDGVDAKARLPLLITTCNMRRSQNNSLCAQRSAHQWRQSFQNIGGGVNKHGAG